MRYMKIQHIFTQFLLTCVLLVDFLSIEKGLCIWHGPFLFLEKYLHDQNRCYWGQRAKRTVKKASCFYSWLFLHSKGATPLSHTCVTKISS